MRNAGARNARADRIARSYRGRGSGAIGAIAGVLLATFPSPPGAETLLVPRPEAERSLLAEAARAVFPSTAPESLRAFRAAGVIERTGEVVGRFETIARRQPAAFREETEMDGVRQVVTLLDDEGWLEDANGAVRRASGDELVACRLAHALLFHDWLDGDVPGFDVRIDVADSNAPTVRFLPLPAGPERRLVLARDDAGRLLPDRLDRVEQGTNVTTTFEDWRPLDGTRFPFTSRQLTGDPRFDVLSRTTSVELADSIAPADIPRPRPRTPADARLVDPERARRIPLERIGGIFLVRLEVGSESGLGFLLDTGAGATIVSAELAARLGLTSRGVLEARGAGGSEAAVYVSVPAMTLPGVEIDAQTLVSLPLEGIGAAIGARIDGILGWDFVSRFAVEIDEPRRMLAVFPAGGYAPRPGMVRVPLRVEANVPRVEGVLEGRFPGSFLVDTGNAARLLLHTGFAKRHGFLERARESALTLSGIGGAESMREVTVASLALGPVVLESLEAVLAPEGSGVVSLEESIGNLGASLFDGRVLALDYGAGALWLSAEAEAESADPVPSGPTAASVDSASAR